MADDMEVDAALSSPSCMKRSSMYPHPSPIDKPDRQQDTINEAIVKLARRQYWQDQVDDVGGDDSEWWAFFSLAITFITSDLKEIAPILPLQVTKAIDCDYEEP
ncbi:hypothetical protein AX14_005983 [Amanita brunnescens Koide BX004]|nr:hypothetical protein AX14_005983 [Amanita brunnescens Koide BX004]